MEERKLIRLGNSSFAIALPKEWIGKSGLQKGDKVFIVPNSNGELIISSEFTKEVEKEISLDLKDKEETLLQTELIGSYLKNYNLLKIKNDLEDKKRKHIKDLVRNLMSFEIVEESKEEIKLKDVFNLDEANITRLIKRVDNIVRSFYEDLVPAIKRGKIDKKISNEIQDADKEITKLYLLVGRVFMKSLNNPSLLNSLKINCSELFTNWWIVLHVEKIGDDLKYIAKILEKSIKPREELNVLFKLINENYNSSLNSYYQKDKSIVEGVIEKNKKIISDIEKINKDTPEIVQITERLKSLQGNIFQISKMISYLI